MSFLDYTGPGGFTPGSKEAMRAVHCEHRYELKAVAHQAAAIHPVGRRILTHTRQAEIDARNAAEARRQLEGRRSAAALEWLLKRQQERNQGEQEVHRPMRRGAGALSHSHTSPNNPLYIQPHPTQRSHTPTPEEMAAALAAMDLSHSAGTPPPATATAAAGAAPEPAADTAAAAAAAAAAATAPCSSGSSFSSSADSSTGSGSTGSDSESDAVAVVSDLVGDVPVPAHLVCHMETANLAPVQPEPASRHTPCQTATQAAYWRQLEMDELVGELLQRYPHGIPKKMLHDLRQLGINDAPGLGFGCSSSSLGFDTMLLKPV